jgi:hypothetical protein
MTNGEIAMTKDGVHRPSYWSLVLGHLAYDGPLTLSGTFTTIRDSLLVDSTSGGSRVAVSIVWRFALETALVVVSAARHTDDSRMRGVDTTWQRKR